MYFKIFWFILACYYLAFLFIASTVGRCCRRMQSAVKSLLGLFTNTSASVWKTVVQPLANMALLSSDSCTTTAAAGSLLGAKSKEEEEEEEESSHPCLMKITRTDQRGKKVQTSNHSGNEHSGSGVDEVDQPKMQNQQQQQITQGVDMELLLKSLAITLQTMLHNAFRRVHSISYLMDSQLLLQVENNRLEVYRCQYQARLQLLKLQQRQHSTEPALLMHCQKSQQQQQQPKYSLSLRFQCQCQISSLSYDIDDQREHIIDRQSGRLLPVPLSLWDRWAESQCRWCSVTTSPKSNCQSPKS